MTVLGAWMSASGRQEVSDLFRQLESAFSDCTSYSHDIVAAEVNADMAYTVGGLSPRGWGVKVAHRHADTLPQPEKPEKP